jgi:hypothetical protein
MNSTHWAATLVMAATGLLTLSCQSPRQETDPAKSPSALVTPPAPDPSSDSTFAGAVVHVDMAAHLLTVKSATDQKAFMVKSKTKVITETSAHGALSTLNTGDLVEVEYEQQGAAAMATRVVRKAVAAGRKPAPDVERLERMLNPDPNNPYKMD